MGFNYVQFDTKGAFTLGSIACSKTFYTVYGPNPSSIAPPSARRFVFIGLLFFFGSEPRYVCVTRVAAVYPCY